MEVVRPSTLLTGVQTGALDILAQALLAATAVFFLLCLRRLSRRGRPASTWRAVAFLAGLFFVWVAVGSGLAGYDDTDVTVHVVQHLLLMMVAPPLLVLGRPLVVAMQSAPRPVRARTARALGSAPVRLLTHPVVSWTLYFSSMAVMLTDRSVYHYLVTHDLQHEASHLWLIITGLLYWEPLLGGVTSGRRMSHPARMMSMLASMPFEVLIGIWLRYQTSTLDPVSTLADTQRAGEAFIVGATLVSTVWLVTVVVQWGRAVIREERRVALQPATEQWSTPWWVLAEEANGAAGGP